MSIVDETLAWERLATNLRVERVLLEALEALDGLDVVVFKGGLLTRRIYGDLRSRASADNDLLVRSADGPEALGRLMARGYAALPGLDATRALVRNGQVALFRGAAGDEPSLDLHVSAFSPYFFSVAPDVVWSHLETVSLHGRQVTTFDAPLAFCHMVAHFLQHLLEVAQLEHIGRAWETLGRAVPSAELRAVAARTCGEASLEYVLGLAAEFGHVSAETLPMTKSRARLAARVAGRPFLDRGPTSGLRALVVLWVTGPGRLPAALTRGFLPEMDELVALYGEGSRGRLLLRHWQHRVRD